MSGLVGAVIEAWDELRIHKVRVLLALVGVAVAVTAITGVTAAVAMLRQAYAEQLDRNNGRQVTVTLSAWPMSDQAPAPTALEAEYARTMERYSITWASRDLSTQVPVRFPNGTHATTARAVDPDLGTMNRIQPTAGRWFVDDDVEAFAPLLVVNEAFLAALGVGDLSARPTALLGDEAPVRATVIGVVADQWPGMEPQLYLLYDHLERWYQPNALYGPSAPSLAMWVPAEIADELGERIRRDVAGAVPGWQVEAWDNRFVGADMIDDATRWVGLGVGAFALLLGGLGLVNIALVTVRYRIREIGVRRSFGATSGRVFFGVLMESVVATVVAGLVGVVIAVALVKSIPVESIVGGGIQDMPAFPVSAALIGMACATAVGALAGLIPATVAVRVKVIDAIRY